MQEGKGRTDVFSGLDESEKGDSREVAGRKEGCTGRGPCNVSSWSMTKKPSQQAWREGGGALAPENAKYEMKHSPQGPAVSRRAYGMDTQ